MMLALVEYRDVPGFPGYRVGSDGSVWSCWTRGERIIDKRYMGEKWVQLRPGISPLGYSRASLWRDGKKHQIPVHAVVLSAFSGPRPEGMVGAHENNDPRNNRPSNLRWKTQKENMADKFRHGTRQIGERSPGHKLSNNDVAEIRRRYVPRIKGQHNRTGNLRELAREFGVMRSTIHCIVRRRTWSHVA